jgi:acyl phosphate:glycerol-3-phosphate acyltransferase
LSVKLCSFHFAVADSNISPVPILSYAIMAIAGYLLGSIPTGFIVGKARGVDIRTLGSKNMGATNVFRVLGKGPGILVLIVDGLKGYAACLWLNNLLSPMLNVPASDIELHQIVGGIAAVLGHNYTCWLNFKGGKGIATSAGVFLALAPFAVGVAVATWIVAVLITRYVSVASIAAAVALPTVVWLTSNGLCLRLVTTGLGVLAIAKHKDNIKRLLHGTERRFGGKPEIEEVAE